MLKLAALISGGGRTVVNLAEQIERGTLDASIEIVIASRPKAGGIERARSLGLRTAIVARRQFADSAGFSHEIFRQVCAADVTPQSGLICLAGFLSFLEIPDDFIGRIVNIHPALLPQFGGKGMYGDRVHQEVLQAGAKHSGCSVHFADDQYDHGPVIAQRQCVVSPDDTAATLADRVFALECELYPTVLQAFAEDRIELVGRDVRIQGEV